MTRAAVWRHYRRKGKAARRREPLGIVSILTAVFARLCAWCAVVILGALTLPGAADAAETTGTIAGHVRAAGGAPIAGASVVAVSASGRYRLRTDASGRYLFVAVGADTYLISAEASGFAAQEQRGVTVYPARTVSVDFTLGPALREIGRVRAPLAPAFVAGAAQDSYTVAGAQARGPASASASGLASYGRGTVQGAVVAIPGVQQDQFSNVILRGGKVDDVVFSYDAVPVPQAIIAEPGGNVIGAQLPTTGLGYTTVTTGGFAGGAENALGGLIDEVPEAGVYPAITTLTTGLGVSGAAHDVELQRRWAAPSLRQRYAVDVSLGNQRLRYGDGRTFYPAEVATYGLSLQSRATWSASVNAHIAAGARDDIELLALAGEATYDQYGTPFTGETTGAFDGRLADGTPVRFPGTDPSAPVTAATRIRGTYAIEKAQLLRSYDRSYARLYAYRSQYGSRTRAPFFDDLSFPNGAISYDGGQAGDLRGAGLDVVDLSGAQHRFSYGADARRQASTLDQLVPALAQRLTAAPALTTLRSYLSDEWMPVKSVTVQGTLRESATHVRRSDGRAYGVGAIDPHLSAVFRRGPDALRVTFDRSTVAPKPLQAERQNSTQPNAPFVALAPEAGTAFEFSYEHGTAARRVRFTLFSKDERNRIDVAPLNIRAAGGGGAATIGVPRNVGALLAAGAEASYESGPFALAATYVHARSSSASQFALNDLNAPALSANHLFPAGYVPDASAVASYRLRVGRFTIAPALSYETGYPYGNGRSVWTYDTAGAPVQVINDNHVNPGYNYFFLRDPGRAFDPATNPIVATLGTPEGGDPNTLRSTPLLLASLHVDAALTPRLSLQLDVANLFGTATPTQLQGNPYLIGPPGYTGGNAAYAAWYGTQLGGGAYALGNGVPTNDGRQPVVPWTYGTGGYVPSSYPEARSVYLRLRLTL